jgi:hypothetical protein
MDDFDCLDERSPGNPVRMGAERLGPEGKPLGGSTYRDNFGWSGKVMQTCMVQLLVPHSTIAMRTWGAYNAT